MFKFTLNMVNKSGFLILGVSVLIGAGFLKLPVSSAEPSSVSLVSLQVPRTDEMVDSLNWCQSSSEKGSEHPLGFSKVRFYRDKSSLENKDYLIGCITNNSKKTFEQLPASYNAQYPPNKSQLSVGFSSLNILLPLQPGQTAYFRSDFGIDTEAIGVEIVIQESNKKEQTLTYEPIQRLSIKRVQSQKN